ncbi:MAG: S26 family signal peptidase, partial [Myxococcota bacterium]|nr:S26 family signal peptidase [Myxococcota bacterium]
MGYWRTARREATPNRQKESGVIDDSTADDATEGGETTPDDRTVVHAVGEWLWDQLVTWGPALLVVLLIRSVVAEPFRIPSGSMVPTLAIGDHILVTKYSYGLRVPLTRIPITDRSVPERGDVVV